MEERKLNFNAPLLSVRRYSTIAEASSNGENGKTNTNSMPKRTYTIPFYRTDLNLEQVTEPAAVPFMWEQIPGRPKDGGNEPQHSEEASVTPRLPPQRALDIAEYPLEKEVEDRPRIESYSLNEYVARLDSSKEGNDEVNSDVENDDDVYSDALDTLSPTDSVSINCSASGLSGCDGQVVKQSGTFSTDPQTRDFMMSRFLPAAKAMALEPAQYASKKQPVAVEQPRQVMKVVPEDRRPLVNESIVIPHYGENVKEEEEQESEDEVDECDDPGNLSGKACGLLPRLCFNKSLCLLNPVPSLKIRTHSSMSSSSDVRNSSKAVYTKSHSQIVKKYAWDAVHKHQADSGIRSPKLLGIENKVTYGSNQFACSSDQQMASRSSPFRRGISPYRSERPHSPFHGGGFLGVPKEAEIVRANKLNSYNRPISKSQELFPHQSFKKGSGSPSPAVEKTLYVDTVNFAKRSWSSSSSSDTKGQIDSVGKSSHTSMEIIGIEKTVNVESPLQYAKCLNDVTGENISETIIFGSLEANQSSFSEILHSEGQADMVQCSRLDGDLNQECKALVCIKVADDEYLNNSREQKFDIDDPLTPPLPKKPSESWLWRTLPSVSSRNPFSHSNTGSRFNPKEHDLKTLTKWETIVKTSYAHHDRMRYSEELTGRFSQQSKN